MKANAISALIISMNNDLVDLIATHTDPDLAWAALKVPYASGDHSQILTLSGHLQALRLCKGGSVEDYLK